jgi:hypothetical protein
MDDKTTVQCWENLANAIVLQAIEDYGEACRALRRRPDLKIQAERKRSLERFFSSRWFHTLSALEILPILQKIGKGE